MSKLGRLIQRRRQNRRSSPIKALVDQESGKSAPAGLINSEIPINEAVGTDLAIRELTEIRAHLMQASFDRRNTSTSEAKRAMRMDRSSYRSHAKNSPNVTIKSEMRYAEFFGTNWLSAGNFENQEAVRTFPNFSPGDEDFELVLRHF